MLCCKMENFIEFDAFLQLYLIDNYEIIYLSIYFKMTDEK